MILLLIMFQCTYIIDEEPILVLMILLKMILMMLLMVLNCGRKLQEKVRRRERERIMT